MPVYISEFDENAEHYHGFFGKSFGQAWHRFKEKKRANSVALNANLTYITLPWHRIIAGKFICLRLSQGFAKPWLKSE